MTRQKNKNPKHDCKVLGPDVIVPRAFNTAEPEKFYFKCPFCDYTAEENKKLFSKEIRQPLRDWLFCNLSEKNGTDPSDDLFEEEWNKFCLFIRGFREL